MPASSPNRFLLDVYAQYPDSAATKQLVLNAKGYTHTPASGDRHVLIEWLNGTTPAGEPVYQFIQLLGNPGNYAYYSPHAKVGSDLPRESNESFVLGDFTREERDTILKMAGEEVKFEKRSVVNSCRTWTRDLLVMMVERGLLSEEVFEEVDRKVPLKKRVPEVVSCLVFGIGIGNRVYRPIEFSGIIHPS